jgi:cyanophycinase
MNSSHGALALVGSGEYSEQMQEFEAELLQRAIARGKRNTFIQIPTASSHEGDARRNFWREKGAAQAARIGATCIYLPIHERSDALNEKFLASIREDIAHGGLIYFSGGDPHRVAEIFSGTAVWNEIVNAWSSGTSLAGCSAGAMAFGGTIMGLRRSHHSAGLGLLPQIEVIPHYDKMLGWLPERVTAFVLRHDAETTLLGIDENTALVKTETWQSYGRGKVHILRGALAIDQELFQITKP